MTQQKQTQSYLVPFIIMVVLMALPARSDHEPEQAVQAPMQAAFLQKSGSLTNAFHHALITFAFFLGYLSLWVSPA